MKGVVTVLMVRLDALEAAIRDRDWKKVEWEFDRTRRAAEKVADDA